MKAERVGVRRRRLGHVECEEGSVRGSKERERLRLGVGTVLIVIGISEKFELNIRGCDHIVEKVVPSRLQTVQHRIQLSAQNAPHTVNHAH